MKNSSLQLRKRWIVYSHSNQLPPEPVLNLFSYDNSPQLIALVKQPVDSGCLLLKVSQQGTGSVQTFEGDQSITGSPGDCPADGITPFLNLKLICPWTSDVPQTLYTCNSLSCLERRCWTSLDLFQTLRGVLVILWNDTNHMKLMICNSLWSTKNGNFVRGTTDWNCPILAKHNSNYLAWGILQEEILVRNAELTRHHQSEELRKGQNVLPTSQNPPC